MPSSPAPAQIHLLTRCNSGISGGAPAPAAISNVSNADQDDVDAARRGVTDAFARLFDRHAPLVLALCRTQGSNSRAEADDALQESFIRAFRMLDRLKQPAAFRPWLLAIARNVCAERRRSLTRRRHHEDAIAAIGPASSDDAPTQGVDDAAYREDAQRLDAALRRLPESLRLAIHLHYLHDDPVAVASTLGLSRGGYYKQLARARRQLAALLGGVPTP